VGALDLALLVSSDSRELSEYALRVLPGVAVLSAVLLGLTLLSALDTPAERTPQDDSARRGKVLFARSCAACHGRGGHGDGPGARDLDPRPRDLTTTYYRFRSTPSGSPPRDEDLKRTIRRGLPGSAMPAFGETFTEEQLDDLTHFIATLHGAEVPEAIAPPQVGPTTPESVREGRAIYALMSCWSCHGTDGAGRGPAARGLTDATSRPIRATDFRHDPLKGGRDAVAIVRTLLTGLNGTPMPAYGEAMLFAREDVQDLTPLTTALRPEEIQATAAYVQTSPSRAELDALDASALDALRDRRLAALAHYVLSLDQRKGAGFKLFTQQPEREARRP
jgi:mono/diheme cytochrome c family protein